jgi:cell pole-organizing protein PopZ
MRGRLPDVDAPLRRIAPPHDAELPNIAAELVSTTKSFKEGSSDCHIATAAVPSAEICSVASIASIFTEESVVIGPQEAIPPDMVAELVFTCFLLFAAFSRHSAVALVPSLEMAILKPIA